MKACPKSFCHSTPKTLSLAVALALSPSLQAATFDAYVENGDFDQANGVDNTFINGLTVNGNWNLNSGGSGTDMFFDGAQTVGGTGFINLSDNTQNRIFSSGNALLTIDTDLTIRGAGQLGINQTFFDNQGTILAQGNNTLSIDSGGFTNNGVLRAEGAGGLVIISTTMDNNTSVDVDSGSKLVISSSTVNGVFNTAAGGDTSATGSTFDAATINGAMNQANAQDNTFANGLTVNGSWNLNSGGSGTDMSFNGAQTLTGTGEVVMSDSTQNRIFSSANALVTIDNDLTIRGAGQLGIGQTFFDNQGTILAQGASTLGIDSDEFTNNGVLRAEGAGGLVITGTTLNNNTSVDVDNGSKLLITSSTVNGVFNTTAGGDTSATGSTFDAATINGAMNQANAQDNTFANGLTVNGSWNLNSSGSSTDMSFTGAQTLTGTGEVVMSDNTQNRIFSSGNALVTIDNDLTIRGAGQVGINQTFFDNQGTILAQGASTLSIDSDGFTNNGVLRAEGVGGLAITGTTMDNNTSVDVDSGSKLLITSSTVNGVIDTAAGGDTSATGSTFDAATINGAMNQANAQDNTFANGLTVNGSWNLNSSGSSTDMSFTGAQTLTGTGEVVMSDNTQNRIFSSGNALVTIDNDLTIRGAGQVGINQTFFDNQGTILAQGASTLSIDSDGFTNNGVLRAEGVGGLAITGTTMDNNTSVDVDSGSKLLITSSTVNGVIDTAAGGDTSATGSTFDAATINGAMNQANAQDNTFANGLTVNGSWNLNSSGSSTDMSFTGAQTITGPGAIVMTDNTQNRIFSSGNALLTVDTNTTIRGAGQIGINQTSVLNKGALTADGANVMTIDTGGTGLENQGTLAATGTGGINIAAGAFTSSGNVTIDAASKITRTGTYIQTAGETNVNGLLESSELVDIQGGLLSGSGLITADVSNSGTVGPGNSAGPGLLSIDGDYSQSAIGLLDIELGGLVSGSEYDVLAVTGTANLGGTLGVSLIDGFTPTIGDSFDILSAETINGSFDILQLVSGNSNWQVQYLFDEIGTTDVVRLTALTSVVPIPAAAWLFGSGLLGLLAMAKRRKH